jgi:hypothetical protein
MFDPSGKRTISLPLFTRVPYDLDDGSIRMVETRYNLLVIVEYVEHVERESAGVSRYARGNR